MQVTLRITLDTEAQNALKEIEKNFSQDFTTSRGFFNEADEKSLRHQALEKLEQKLASTPAPVSAVQLREAWNAVVADFHRSNYWGFSPTTEKRVKVLNEEQKIRRELWPYIWVMIQSGIILKTAVYYFGIRSSDDPSPLNLFFLGLALATSAGTLIFFAWRKSRK